MLDADKPKKFESDPFILTEMRCKKQVKFGPSGLNVVSGPRWPKCFWVPDPRVQKYFEISWFYRIHPMILE